MCARALKLFNCHIDCVQTTPKIDLNIGSIKRVYLKVYAYVCIVCLFGNCTCFKDISVRGAAGVVTISLQPSGWSGRSLSCSTVRQVHLPSWLPFAILRLNDSAGINMTNGALLFYSIQPVRARVFATRATRAVQSDSQNERERDKVGERRRGITRVSVCIGFVQFMSKWPSLTWHKQTNTPRHVRRHKHTLAPIIMAPGRLWLRFARWQGIYTQVKYKMYAHIQLWPYVLARLGEYTRLRDMLQSKRTDQCNALRFYLTAS